MQGTASQPSLLTAARNQGMRHIAFTETNGLWGFIRFVQHAYAAKVEPIAGVNLITEQGEAVLLAENQNGYENISRIVSAIHDKPIQSIVDLLKDYTVGLFILAHERSTLSSLSKIIPNSHLFVELRPGVTERAAQQLSREFKLEIVATGDVYFIRREDWHTHRILRAIDLNTTLSKLPSDTYKSGKHWFRTEKDMVRIFPNRRVRRDTGSKKAAHRRLGLKDIRQDHRDLRKRRHRTP